MEPSPLEGLKETCRLSKEIIVQRWERITYKEHFVEHPDLLYVFVLSSYQCYRKIGKAPEELPLGFSILVEGAKKYHLV